MTEIARTQVNRSLIAAEGLYNRLVLLVGGNGSGKTGILREVAAGFGTTVLNINLDLSSKLLELNSKQRSLRLPGILEQIADRAQTLVVLDNLEILFDPALQQDPLRLLQGISRNRTVLAAWSGCYEHGVLTYAAPGHPEFRACRQPDALIVSLKAPSTTGGTTD